MRDFKLNIQKVIFQNPKSFLEKLRDFAVIPFNEFEEWKDIYRDIYKEFAILFFNREDIKNPPKNYFRVFLYHSDPEKTRKNLIENYEAINSRYYNLHMFVPVKFFEKLIDESFSYNEFDIVHLSELCYEQNIKWDLMLLRKFKKLISEFRKHEYLSINSKTKIKLSFKIVEEFKDNINWGSIIHFKELKWTLPKLLKYKNYIKFENYEEYSANGIYRDTGFSLALKTNWNKKTIDALSEYWNWKEICLNENIKWDIDLIEKFNSKVDFDSLSLNSKINWTIELIESFEEYWNWENLSGNPGLPWSLNLLKKYDNKWQWTVKYDWYYGTGGGQENENNYYPSISTNPGILWNVKMIEFGKPKIDFWRLARRGNLSLAVVKKIKKELYREEHTGWVFHKSSDFEHIETIYLTGWENLSKNELFKISPESIDFLFNNKITLTYSIGNLARSEGKYVTSKFRLIEIFKNSRFINEEFMDSVFASDKYRHFFINDDFINDEIWGEKIIPYTLKNRKRLLNNFRKNIAGYK